MARTTRRRPSPSTPSTSPRRSIVPTLSAILLCLVLYSQSAPFRDSTSSGAVGCRAVDDGAPHADAGRRTSSSSSSSSSLSSSTSILPMAYAFVTTGTSSSAAVSPYNLRKVVAAGGTRLYSLKPAALPLMDSGKALARSGELLIDLTTSLDLYGGSLSATGANIRNCGDCLAQAAASCRFKTAAELVIDELREGADCLREGSDKLSRAVEESEVDENAELAGGIGNMIAPTKQAALCLEMAGASIMQREAVEVVGGHLVSCGEAIGILSAGVGALDPSSEECKTSAQRMLYASQQMIVAGKELSGGVKKEKPKGKGWIKG